MAVYKIPQDVEADDKLLGPFSFRQFIYLIIAAMGIAIGWILGRLSIPLAIIPLPIIVLFGALALPLRKDQPMEIYLAAILSFYLKPRKRVWQADGIHSLVEIVAPQTVEEHLTKDISQTEAERRLSYLANIVDSRGWAVRGLSVAEADDSLKADVYYEARQAQDVLDDSGLVAHKIEDMIDHTEVERRKETLDRMHQPALRDPAALDPYMALVPPETAQANENPTEGTVPLVTDNDVKVTYSPYPSSMRQAVLNPLDIDATETAQSAKPSTPTGTLPISPDILNLANNSDLSIETIAHEAQRIHEKELRSSNEEVVVSLR